MIYNAIELTHLGELIRQYIIAHLKTHFHQLLFHAKDLNDLKYFPS